MCTILVRAFHPYASLALYGCTAVLLVAAAAAATGGPQLAEAE
jgi:hypothetical protein